MKVKDVGLGKIAVPMLLKTMSLKEAYNFKKKKIRREKKKELKKRKQKKREENKRKKKKKNLKSQQSWG